MKRFRADLHIHTVLSACADLGMSPAAIVRKAVERELDIIAATDHNSTLHGSLVGEIAGEAGLAVVYGVEVTTREEVHCLAYFRDLFSLGMFQEYLEEHLPAFRYLPEKFGYQVVVDRDEKIREMIKNFLNVGLNQGVNEVEHRVHRLGGIFIPAHIERPLFGIISQLGFLPRELKCDALGIMSHSSETEIRKKYNLPDRMPLIKASDAHRLEDIGSGVTCFEMESPTFDELVKALKGQDGRRVVEE
jgi:PHP family Zn ribbon phosphoesterase